MNNKARIIKICAIVLTAAIALTAIGVVVAEKINSVENNPQKMLEYAKELREKGNNDEAYYQLGLYVQQTSQKYDGYVLMGDWYTEDGKTEKAFDSYQKAAENKTYDEKQLSVNNTIESYNYSVADVTIEIKPAAKYTKNMQLTIISENLAPEKNETGKIAGTSTELNTEQDCKTTDWFNINDVNTSLTMTGNFNCAVWQFSDAEGGISTYTDNHKFRKNNNVLFTNISSSTAEIPKDSVKARVTYYDNTIEECIKANDSLVIQYGNIEQGYTTEKNLTVNIPDMNENQYLTYSQNQWVMHTGDSEEILELDAIQTKHIMDMSINGDLCGYVTVTDNSAETNKADVSKQYGIKYSTESATSVCQRLGDAQGMKFNYAVGDQMANSGENDFDSAYPWCEMKLCNVSQNSDGEQSIVYQGEEGFATDGTNGNVMVEIPKFYANRTVSDGYEYLWISGEKHKNYILEPVFQNSDGSEADYVYMSAYLGSVDSGVVESVSGKNVTLNEKYIDVLNAAKANGSGYSEMNYLMASALQKLFVVETGTLDSSSVFAGDTDKLYFYEKDGKSHSFATKDENAANVIEVEKNSGTLKLEVGSNIAIFEGWENYNGREACREVENITQNEDETLAVQFSGDPVDIVKGKTAITNVPEQTGKTDSLKYCSSTLEGTDGKMSFKYRGIENLYGSALIMLDSDAYVNNGYFTFIDAFGNKNTISQPVAEQKNNLSDYTKANEEFCIKGMTYDEDNPLIMVPSVVGNGASAFSGYGDFWMYENNDKDNYLLYGGADDNARIAGVFQLRAVIKSENVKGSFYSSRIMYKPQQ